MKIRFLAIALLFSVAGSLFADPGQFVCSISGTRKYQKQNNQGNNVIASAAVNAKSICATFGVSTKDYAVVYDTNDGTLNLIPLRAADMLSSFQILVVNSTVETYNSQSPSEFLSADTFGAGGDAGGTDFAGITGVQTFITKMKNGNPSGVIGTYSGAAAGSNPDYSDFLIKFSGTKTFTQH